LNEKKILVFCYSLALNNKSVAKNLLLRSKIVFMISHYIIQSLTIGAFSVGILTILNYDIYDFLLYGITWVIIWTVWCYYVCLAIYWPPGYLFIVCYYLKLRLISFQIRLKTFSQRINRLSMKTKSFLIKCFLKEHNELCQQIFIYNKFWRKYLTITLTIFVLLICFLIYLLFIAPMKWYFRFELSIALSGHILLVFVVTYSASIISHFNSVIVRDLYSICFNAKVPIVEKLKVC
jgi:hypothetical protein